MSPSTKIVIATLAVSLLIGGALVLNLILV